MRRRPTLAQRAEAAQLDGPLYAWPACELCGGDLDAHGLGYWTAKGRPRRFCSLLCRQTGNSRAGAPIRAELARQRVRAGTWQNPADYHTAETLQAAAEAGGAARAAQHLAALDAGTWQNPADAPGARDKLSRPRTTADNPHLHRAIERLGQGAAVGDLEPAEAEALRAWQRERARALRRRPPNLDLRAARQAAGLSIAELARRAGVAYNTAWRWDAHGAHPRDPETRRRAAAALGADPWADDNEEGR